MSLSAVILYGSCARRDNSPESDVDLFGVGSNSRYKMVVKNNVNLAIYPHDSAINMSRAGDLFMFHIVSEGVAVYDSKRTFSVLKKSFSFKENYSREIEDATALGWVLAKFYSVVSNGTLLNKRIAWCVRTILIARGAERRQAVFSSKDLASFAQDGSVSVLLSGKSDKTVSSEKIAHLRAFLARHGGDSGAFEGNDLDQAYALFQSGNNAVGEKTVRAMLGEITRFNY